ncbi:hypothetical protein EZV62_013267 [Acer yangbiense]|uniref:Leucine-rich repeat-containing N-terminal plant-type domain-containing protein n=1 Tax=Acer yangbiense TaxID=1000413 RepID=A0A5C7HYK8_9ROSI|nr:hypothetical protein EZV62_013267 [Acer yangbiense]
MGLKQQPWMWVFVVVLIIIVSLESRWSEGCLEQERFALLQLKSFFNTLDSWVEGDHNSDCCQWNMVLCNDTTGRVISLFLYGTRNWEEMGEWYLNASLFSPFQQLHGLDLGGNLIAGCVENEGFDKLSTLSNLEMLYLSWRLSNLEYLDLSVNIFNNNILSSLSALSSLKTLYLGDVGLEGSVDLSEIFDSLSKLEELDLSNNHINKLVVTKDNSNVGLRNLQYINLSNVSIHDGSTLLRSLGSLPYLKRLDLSYNNFSRNIMSTRKLHNFTNLEELTMQGASLHASLLQSIAAFTSLERLIMEDCQLNGIIDTKDLSNLKNLKYLSMERTNLNISILQNIGLLISLESLSLGRCNLEGTLPDQGGIPEHLAKSCINLRYLVLSNNSLEGQIFSAANFNLTNLWRLQLDGNQFIGKIPECLLNSSYLVGLYLGDNLLSGKIPSWLGNMSHLVDLIMPNNHLEGPIPPEFCQLQHLQVLNLAENNISGDLPSCFSPPQIQQVHLSKNKLEGQLKDAFFNSSTLVTLDLGYNHFNGGIPNWIGRLSNLTYLILTHNNLEGEVPYLLCHLERLRLIDLSHNNFSRQIPHCLDMTALHGDFSIATESSEVTLEFATEEESYFFRISVAPMRKEETVEFTTKTISYSYQGRILTYMSGVDLSYNKLTGEIPHQIGNLTRIHTLNLSYNNLTRSIPWTFSNLEQIESLDLSHNNLNGKIPQNITELFRLSVFSVAYNNLSGKTPERINQFGTFEESSYQGNPLLCGLPLPKSCGPPPPLAPKAVTDIEEDNNFMDMDIFYISFTATYIVVVLAISIVLYVNPYWRRTWFYLVETWMTSCYYFIIDHLPKGFRH